MTLLPDTVSKSGKQTALPRPEPMATSTGSEYKQRAGAPVVVMPFIVSSDLAKADPTTRKLIRSHVMRGKKQKKCPSPKNRRATSSIALLPSHNQLVRAKLEEVSQMYTPLSLGRVGSDLAFINLADHIEPSTLLNMTKVSAFALKIMFPLVGAMGFEADNKEWLHLVGLDAAALHITAFAVEAFIDKVLRCRRDGNNVAAMLHFERGLSLLRERLLGEDNRAKVADSTIGVVLKLASAAHFDWDYKISKQHMEGIRRMVDLRGGLDVFKGKQLFVDIIRCDLGIALLNGSDRIFYTRSSEPVIRYPEKLQFPSDDKMYPSEDTEFIRNLNDDLATAWRNMRRFCMLINLGMQTQRLIRPEVIYETMTAVMYRLLDMRFCARSVDEAIRHGLLAFCYHVFLQWQDIKPPYHAFPAKYRACLLDLELAHELSPQLMLWLLMTGAISVFNIADESWLMELLRVYVGKYEVRTWKKMQEILKSFMWIPLLDEQPGKQIYDFLQSDGNKSRM